MTDQINERWQRIPAELRQRPQWCLAGEDKRPLTVDGYAASVTDPATWTDFSSACRSAAAKGCSIGYMQTADDPFACIDMDVKDGTDPDALARYYAIIDAFGSYTEHSRSGRGFHVWVRGKIGEGRRRDGVEVYSQARFMICTGNVLRDHPIAERQEMLSNMVARMSSPSEATGQFSDGPALAGDAEILGRARAAENGVKFAAHFDGDFAAIGHTDHSVADMTLIAMLAFYTPNNEQLKRLFLASALGQRDKAQKRRDYVDRTIRAVRASQAAGPTAEHGREMALAIFHGAWLKNTTPATEPPIAANDDANGQPDKSLLERLRVDWSAADDAEVPDIVAGLVADEDVTLLGGHGGVGKGFLALQMCCAVALGEPVLGHATRQARVLYYSAEDGRKRLTRRLRRVVEQFDYNEEGLRQNLVVIDASEIEPLYGESIERSEGKRSSFIKMLGPRSDFDNLQKMVEEFDPQLVVIDGASDTFDGNEIARREVRAFIKMLRRVHPQKKIGVLVLVHIDRSSARGHSSNDDGYSGSAQWHNSCRRRMFLQHEIKKERDDDGTETIVSERYLLRVMKNQDGPAQPDFELQRGQHGLWQLEVEIGGGLAPTASREADHSAILARLIGEYYDRGKYISTSLAPQASTGAYPTLKDDPDFPRGLSRKRTVGLVRQLERDGVLVAEPYKRPNRAYAERWMVMRLPGEPFKPAAQTANTGTG